MMAIQKEMTPTRARSLQVSLGLAVCVAFLGVERLFGSGLGLLGDVLYTVSMLGLLVLSVMHLWCFIQAAGPATATNKNRFVDRPAVGSDDVP